MCYFNDYLDFVGRTEAPIIYHRWTAASIIGAALGRNVYLPFGHGKIYPNMYVQLMGTPGTRKGTAIGIGESLLKESGYSRFAADRVSKERFLMEMKPVTEEELDGDISLLNFDAPSEVYVVADEFSDFLGPGNLEFATLLTKLWDNKASYTHPKIHGKSIVVDQPTVNLLSGNTPQGLAISVPAEALGNGFMSRMIFIYAKETGIKISFPSRIDMDKREILVERLKAIRQLQGEMQVSEEAKDLMDKMYHGYIGIDDPRFSGYATRRFTHLLKLAIICAVSRLSLTIEVEDCLRANTMLHNAETKMPKALGEFGRSKYSDASNIVCDALSKAHRPLSYNDLWKLVVNDLGKMTELADILKNLMAAAKIQVITVKGKQGYLPLITPGKEWEVGLLDNSSLTSQELI